MKTQTLIAFPKSKLADATDAIATMQRRIVRAAARAGQAAPAAPTLTVKREYTTHRCGDCGAREDVDPVAHGSVCDGQLTYFHAVDLEITYPAPRLAGWEFLAVIEPMAVAVDGVRNLLKTVPGASIADGELEAYRSAPADRCDHCAAKRTRNETFIVRADGSDPAVELGTLRQVGRDCLAAFLGGKSPAAILAALGWPAAISGLGDGEGGGVGHGEPVWEPAEFLAWTAASVRNTGWCSRGAARESWDGSKQATADHVTYLLSPPFGIEGRAAWEKARAMCRTTDADKARAIDAHAWAKALTDSTDYAINLRLAVHQPMVTRTLTGLVASAIAAYGRFLGDAAKRSERPASAHVGTVGEKIERAATIERVTTVDTQYGALHIHTFRCEDGAILVWRTGRVHGATGERVTVSGKVKSHGEFRGDNQTELTRAKVAALAVAVAA